jgi:hypothetical protein
MANYALVKNGIVENVISAEQEFINQIQSQWDECIDVTSLETKPGIGWLYADSEFENPIKNYARINSNLVEQLYWLHNNNLAGEQAQNQFVVLIEGVDPTPEVGWSYDGSSFSAP